MRQRHQKDTHNFFCSQCDYSTFEGALLKKHIDIIHTTSTFECDHCDFVGKTQFRIRMHIRQKHSNKPNSKWTCPHCEEKFESCPKLKKHCLNEHELLVEIGNTRRHYDTT